MGKSKSNRDVETEDFDLPIPSDDCCDEEHEEEDCLSCPRTESILCTKHPGSAVRYDPRWGCPMCEMERRVHELHQIATGQSMLVTVRFDRENIPPIMYDARHAMMSMRDSLADIKFCLQEIANRMASGQSGDPRCPSCGGEMIEKGRKDGSGKFWSCMNYPRCTGTRSAETLKDTTKKVNAKSLVQEGTGDMIEF